MPNWILPSVLGLAVLATAAIVLTFRRVRVREIADPSGQLGEVATVARWPLQRRADCMATCSETLGHDPKCPEAVHYVSPGQAIVWCSETPVQAQPGRAAGVDGDVAWTTNTALIGCATCRSMKRSSS